MSLEEDRSLQSFIESIPVPIVILNSSLLPMCSNKAGLESFHLLDVELAGSSLGEIVECENSKLPGGCGKTLHCSSCVLRRTVTETYDTGRQSSMIHAKLTTDRGDVSYMVSAMKVGDCVVVKLDTQAS